MYAGAKRQKNYDADSNYFFIVVRLREAIGAATCLLLKQVLFKSCWTNNSSRQLFLWQIETARKLFRMMSK